MKILIVEDDLHLSEVLQDLLVKSDYQVDMVHDGQDGLHYAMHGLYDVIVLDVMLPSMNGFNVVKALRVSKVSTPVLLLTAKSEVADRVHGLDCGADDYLTKPFSTDELLARIRALSRRQGGVVTEELTLGNTRLNLLTYTLETNSKTVNLSKKEFDIMRILLSSPKHIIPKEQILVKVWGYDSNGSDNNVEAYISFLRKKLDYLQSKVVIKTIRGVGYKLEVD